MEITRAEWSAGKLTLETSDPEAIRFAYGFKAGEYTISPAKKPRSLDANAYCWVLIGKLAEALRLPKEEVYRNAIKDIGGNYDVVCVQEKALDALKRGWTHNGLGWQIETMPSKIDGCVNAMLYYGSSVYDARQMSLLIDHIIEDCRALGIETLPPEKLDALKEAWHG